MAPPFQMVEFDIRYGQGIDAVGDLIDRAVDANVLEKSGAYYRFQGKPVGQGRENARAALAADPKLAEALRAALRAPAEKKQQAA